MFHGQRWHSVFTNWASQHECWLICLQMCNTNYIKFQVNTEWLTNTTLINAETKSLVLIMKVRGTMKCEWLNNAQLNNKCEDRNTTDIEFVVLYAGHILHQGYIPAKHRTNWKKKIPFNTVYFLRVRRLRPSSYTVYDNHSVSRSSFPIHSHVVKITSVCVLAKPTCTCTKWFNTIISLWQILKNRMSLHLNQKIA